MQSMNKIQLSLLCTDRCPARRHDCIFFVIKQINYVISTKEPQSRTVHLLTKITASNCSALTSQSVD